MECKDFYACTGDMRKNGGEFRQHADKLESNFNGLQRLKRKTNFSNLSGHEADDLRNLMNFAESGLELASDNPKGSTLTREDLFSLKAELNQYPGVSVSLNSNLAGKVAELLKQAERGLEFSLLPDDIA